MSGRIASSKVSADFLHANSTNHTWAFSAFAELIDNACDAKAREVQIDVINIGDQVCLSFQDDGIGMDKEQLHDLLSFGFCGRHLSASIGKYGNGFKSGSMRLGKDAIVFTRTRESAGVGLLSQTYNNNRDTVLVPMLHYSVPDLKHNEDESHSENLTAILVHSMFVGEKKLRTQIQQLPKTGTHIIIYNLHKSCDNSYLELDFDTCPDDIRCPEIYDAGSQRTSDYKISLKEYLSILYLHPRMKIKLRGNYVKTKLIAKSLCHTQVDEYVPKVVTSSQQEDQYAQTVLKNTITFGLVPDSGQSEDYGMMLYSDNRLIKPYERVQCQRQGDCVGVVGVTQAKFLTPTNMKQDFIRDTKYMSAMKAYNTKLKKYWDSITDQTSSSTSTRLPDSTWAQCDYKTCLKWRRLPAGTSPAGLPDKWYCYMHPDHITCTTPEDMHEDEDVVRPPSRSRSVPARRPAFQLSGLLGRKRSRRQHSPGSEDSDSVSSDPPARCSSHVGVVAASTSQTAHSQAPNSSRLTVDKRADGGAGHETKQMNSQKSKQMNSQKSKQVNSQKTKQMNSQKAKQTNSQKAVSGSARKNTSQMKEQKAVRSSTRQKSKQVKSTETEMETQKPADRGTVEDTDSLDDGSNHEDSMGDSAEGQQGPGVDDTGVSVGVDSETERVVGLSAAVTHDGDDASDLPVDAEPSSDASSSANKDADWAARCSPVQPRNELSQLQSELNELRSRFSNFLNNCRRLLQILVPDIPIDIDTDMEQLIAEMLDDESQM